ncbi:FAD-dependent oxidoreductase [Gordonibacter massiliensis (ex Traore et al. 2017)]|uniref:Flavocytochrome c n=1 Tax=Gordonibacter massiliensis (ex Traore et al. 2017) TaxID=1841863 RepID=A0A842JBX8_9ACTN|nr:flavocytochrome c [Gordonibacter massiliensis (ex Traore et al. 2017)]MBC2888984.1 flavocytochrome c [Gordonibacter massiliensis (ex Traore et al. 2017)]
MLDNEDQGRWDEIADVVIVGSGFAGLVAASEAAKTYERVLVLEKMPYSGGNSRIAGGGYCCWDSKLKLREELGLGEDSWRAHFDDTMRAGGLYNVPELVEVLAKEAPAGLDFLVDAGIPFRKSLPRIGGHSAYRSYQMACSGSETMDLLQEACFASGHVELRRNVAVRNLFREGWRPFADNSPGRVLGVAVADNGTIKNIRAAHGVIVASGGYGRDVELRTAYKPSLSAAYSCTNHKGATGEMIRFAKAVGADAVHMEFVQLYPCADPKTGGIDQAAFLCYSGTGYGLVYVNGTGQRFVNELASREDVSNAQMNAGGKPTYSILNDRIFELLGIGADDIARLVERGRACKAATLSGLAEQAGFDPTIFEEDIARHNAAILTGVDEAFGKPMTSQMAPLDSGDFYAIPQWPSVHYCMGGLRIDAKARVIDIEGKPIPGLYAAGEVCGGVHGIDRLGGNGIAECIVFGRIAGRLGC